MKKITGIVTAGFIIGILMIGCNDSSKKDMKDAKENIKEANQDVKQAVTTASDTAKANAIANWTSFKNESDSAIAGIERDVTTLEGKMAKADKAAKAKLKTDLDKTKTNLEGLKEKLKQRNDEFENEIKKFDATVVSKINLFSGSLHMT
jgi:uncharacterized protein (DUF849 family)